MKHAKLMIAALLALFSAGVRWIGLAVGANLYSQFTYDDALKLKAAALVGATADGTLILDVGTGLLDAFLVIDVSALEVASGDEIYTIFLEGSPDATFGTAGNIRTLARIDIGNSALPTGNPNGADDSIGRFVVPFRNERNGTTYRYLRTSTLVAGTVATGINYLAFVAKR